MKLRFVDSKFVTSLYHRYTNLLPYLAITRQGPRRNSRPTHTRLYAHFRGVWKKALHWRDGSVKAATNILMQKKKEKKHMLIYMYIFVC